MAGFIKVEYKEKDKVQYTMRQKVIQCAIVPWLLQLKTNVNKIPGYTYSVSPIDTTTRYDKTSFKIHLYVERMIREPGCLEKLTSASRLNYYASTDDKLLYIEGILRPKIKFKFIVKNMLKEPFAAVNRLYYIFNRYMFCKIPPVGEHLSAITFYKLLSKGYYTIHSAGFAKEGEGFLLFAPPNTGKTSTVLSFCLQGTGQFVAEDVAVTDGHRIYSCPFTSTYMNNASVRKKLIEARLLSTIEVARFRIRNIIASRIPFTHTLIRPRIDCKRILDVLKLKESAKITKLFILNRSHKIGLAEIDRDEAFKKILFLNRSEFNYLNNRLLRLYFNYYDRDSLSKLRSIEQRVLSKLVETSDCFIINGRGPEDYVKLIKSVS